MSNPLCYCGWPLLSNSWGAACSNPKCINNAESRARAAPAWIAPLTGQVTSGAGDDAKKKTKKAKRKAARKARRQARG